MSTSIGPAQIDEARSRRPLSVVISSYIQLRKVGAEYEGVCPFHDDHSPSLNVNDRKGLYVCRACGAGGDAITFLRQYRKLSFAEAVAELTNAAPETSSARFVRKIKEASQEFADSEGRRWEPDEEARASIAKAQRLWKEGKPISGTFAATYLKQARGISRSLPQSLRFHPNLPYWTQGDKDRPVIAGYHPALLAALQAPNGDIIAVQRIYLLADGLGKAAYPNPKKVMGPMQDGAVRLGPRGRIMGLAEGIETALSASQIYSLPVWASCGATRMRDVWFPPICKELIIFRDNGKAGFAEAVKAAEANEDLGRRVLIEAPPSHLDDWNDVLQARRAA